MSPLPHLRPRSLRALVLSLLLPLLLLGGCASTNPRDPMEPMNRAIYSFNDGLDNAIIRPVAEGYRAVLPTFLRTGVSNIFANINDVLIALNNLLQGKLINAMSDVGRVVVNTTVGIVGFFDVATNLGLEKHNEDFGQTLGYWGIGDGPYLVLPLLGPSNARDTVGRLADFYTDPVTYVRSMSLRNSLWGTRALSNRADLLDTSKILDIAALDPYEFLRDAYLQRRRNLVYDGAPPREKDDEFELKTKPRTNTPSPPSAEDDTLRAGTQVTNARSDDWTPARTDAQDAMRPDNWTPARAETLEAALMPAVAPPALQQQTPVAVTPEQPVAPAVPSAEAQGETVQQQPEPTAAAEQPAAEGMQQVTAPVIAPAPQRQAVTAVPLEPVVPATASTATQAQEDIILPAEPTAAGQTTEEVQQSVQRVRVWVTAAD